MSRSLTVYAVMDPTEPCRVIAEDEVAVVLVHEDPAVFWCVFFGWLDCAVYTYYFLLNKIWSDSIKNICLYLNVWLYLTLRS